MSNIQTPNSYTMTRQKSTGSKSNTGIDSDDIGEQNESLLKYTDHRTINSTAFSKLKSNGDTVLYISDEMPPIDADNLAFDNVFLSTLEPDEKIVYSTEIIKINKRRIRQKRVQLYTNRYLYNLRCKGKQTSILSFFSKEYKIKKRMPLVMIELIIYSKKSDEFVISAPSDYDLHYSSSKRNEILDYLYHARKLANCTNILKFALKSIDFLHQFALHPSQKAKGEQRKIGGEIQAISHNEFQINFCEKKMISENLMDTGSNISLKDFEFLKMLGVGGFSKVYLTREKRTNELFAIKTIRFPEKKDNILHKMQIQHERDILVRIRHPFIVKLKYAFQSSKRFFLVMAFVQGGEMLGYIKRETKKTREIRTKFYAAQIALALKYLHDQGIVYGDLKPENILIDKYGYIKQTDFGASKMLNGNHSIIGFAGTPDYQAPEVLRNKKITKASDWWTFGILLYEMLFGRSPFYHENNKTMFRGILSGTPVFPSKYPVSNEAIDQICSLLRKKAGKRLGNIVEKEIFDHPWFSDINFDELLTKKKMAPILPNIEDECSVENFNKNITNGALKLSFEINENFDGDYPSKKHIDSEELLDFDFVEEDFVETAMHDSFSTSPQIGNTRKFQYSNDQQKLQEVIVEEGVMNEEDISQDEEDDEENDEEIEEKPEMNIELHEKLKLEASDDEETSKKKREIKDYKGGHNKKKSLTSSRN